jgi:hypothetical protein
MGRQLAAIAIAAGTIAATAGAACAAAAVAAPAANAVSVSGSVSGSGSVSASALALASAQAPIRTFTDTVSLQLNGYSSAAAGWYFHELYLTSIVRSPGLAEHGTDRDSGSDNGSGKPYNSVSQNYTVNGVYYRQNAAGKWAGSKLSAAELKGIENGADPYYSLAKFRSIPGVALVGPGHYQVTCTVSRFGSFFAWEYSEPTSILTDNGIKSATLNFWLDSSGRPVKDTITGQGANVRLSGAETFTDYNKPLTIKAP